MRSLGQRLGAGATSLYRHVANKDELIELVVDEVYGELEVPEVTIAAAWRVAMHITAHSLRQTGLRHMWLTHVLGQVGLNYLGPNVVDVTGRSLAILTAAGFDAQEAAKAMSTVSSFVIGITSAEAGWLTALRRQGSMSESGTGRWARRWRSPRPTPCWQRSTWRSSGRIRPRRAWRTSSTGSTSSWTAWRRG